MSGYTIPVHWRLHSLIYRAMRALLRFNARVYGRSASREVVRDLAGEYNGVKP